MNRRRVWVDGLEFGTEKEAAEAAGVPVAAIREALKAGRRMVMGRLIACTPPPEPAELMVAAADLFAPGNPKALLCYPPGEGPLYQGLKRWA
jgi:hypothetical protein